MNSSGFYKKILLASSSSRKLFFQTESEGLWSTFKYHVSFAFLVSAIWLVLLAGFIMVVGFIDLSIMFDILDLVKSYGLETGTHSYFIYIPTFLVLMVLLVSFLYLTISFVSVGIVHFFARLFGGKRGVSASYKTVVYSWTPAFMLLPLPGLNLVALVWTFILMIIRFSQYHSVSVSRSIFSCIFYVITVFIATVLVWFFIVTSEISEVDVEDVEFEVEIDQINFTETWIISRMDQISHDLLTGDGYENVCDKKEIKDAINVGNIFVEEVEVESGCRDHDEGYLIWFRVKDVEEGGNIGDYFCIDHTGHSDFIEVEAVETLDVCQ